MRNSLLFKVNVYFGVLATGFVGADAAQNYTLRDGILLLFALSIAIEMVALATLCVLAIRRYRRWKRFQINRNEARSTAAPRHGKEAKSTSQTHA